MFAPPHPWWFVFLLLLPVLCLAVLIAALTGLAMRHLMHEPRKTLGLDVAVGIGAFIATYFVTFVSPGLAHVLNYDPGWAALVVTMTSVALMHCLRGLLRRTRSA